MRRLLRRAAAHVPVIGPLLEELRTFRTPFPPGHFSNPYPSVDEVRRSEARIFAVREEIPGVDLRGDAQWSLLQELLPHCAQQPFTAGPTTGARYWFDNPMFPYGDGIFLYAMLRHVRPPRVVEIGSGFSSALMLDVADRHPDWQPRFTFIEPYPARLRSLLRAGDADRHSVWERPVQDVPLETYDALESGDLLFIDSTHIAKTGSDVVHEVLEILPRLRPGVRVHVHDIFYPFEYHPKWVYEMKGYNEIYLVRAFLTHNDRYQIELFPNYLMWRHRAWFEREMPLCLREPGGSLWLRRVR